MPKCPYCDVKLEEIFDDEWQCPICGETFIDNGYGSFKDEFESMTDADYDEEDEGEW